jgi:hypothetical protein
MDTNRRLSFIGGLLWLTTFATSIPALFIFYAPALDDTGYVIGAGQDARIATGILLEMILIFANVGTALAFLPILKRQYYALAHGFVAIRIIESVFIAAGIVSVLALLTVRANFADGTVESAEGTLATANGLVAFHDASFLLGPGFVVGIGNGLLLGYLMFRTALVPRWMAVLGMIAGPMLIAAAILILYDVIEPGSSVQSLMSAPEFVWELSLGLYLTFKGFKKAPILDVTPRVGGVAVPAAA